MSLTSFSRASLILIGTIFTIVPAAAHEKPAVNPFGRVHGVCRAVEPAVKPSRAFAIYTDENYKKPPRWVQRRRAKALVVEELVIFRLDKRIRAARLMRTSPSGDWAQYLTYCYRTDGTLAFALADLRTFLGDVRVVDRLYYDADGRQLRKTRRIFDLETKKQITGKRDFQEIGTLIPKTTRALLRHARPAFGK